MGIASTPCASMARIARFRRALMRWFDTNKRSFPWRAPDSSDYVKIISEVLLQRTRAASVSALLPDLVAQFPSWKALARADVRKLQQTIRPLGLWKSRARALVALARTVASSPDSLPPDRPALEQIPAVGQYVASAILLFLHDWPEPLLDANMARVLERYFGPRQLADIRYDPYLQVLARRVVASSDPVQVNWAILDLGAMVCLPRVPRCSDCPLRRGCEHARQLERKRDGDRAV